MKKKKAKKDLLYYLCPIDFMEIEETKEALSDSDLTQEDLDDLNISYCTNFPNDEGCTEYVDDINYREVIKRKKLFKLIKDFIYFIDEDDVEEINDSNFEEHKQERMEILIDEYLILRKNLITNKFSLVDEETIHKCSEIVKFHTINKEDDIILDVKIDDGFYDNFADYIKKCMGKNNSGRILFYSEYRQDYWDVKIVDGRVKMGVDENHDMFFRARLLNMYSEQTVCTIRVNTGQKNGNFYIVELYIFTLHDNYTIKTIKVDDVVSSHSTHFETGKKLELESNVVYCDIDGGKHF